MADWKCHEFKCRLRLFVAFLLCLAPLGCEHQSDVPLRIVRPDQNTQDVAKRIQVSQVACIHLDTVTSQHCLTDRKIVKQLLLGLSRATEVSAKNQVCNVQVISGQNNILLEEDFALDGPQHALSPEFIVGLKQAGISLDWEAKARRQQQIRVALPIVAGVLLLGLITTRVLIRRRARR